MFEKKLQDQFKAIFGVKDVVYDQPGDSAEQNKLFVEVENSYFTYKDAQVLCKVTGNGVLIGPNDKLPFGFFANAIAKAKPSLTKNLFFNDFEENTRRYRNLVQRSFSFVYFFDSQYDPETGNITSIEFKE